MTLVAEDAAEQTTGWRAVLIDLRRYRELRHPGNGRRRRWRLLTTALASPGWWQLTLHRVAHASARRRREGGVWRARLLDAGIWPVAVMMKLLTKNELLEFSVFESGVYLSNKGGIILGARRIGSGTLIHHNVTIGMNLSNRCVPEIGRRVWIGHDCVIHGEISIGDGVTILPGSVLSKSLAPGVVARGNPASIVRRDFDNRALCASLCEDPDVSPAPARAAEVVHAG